MSCSAPLHFPYRASIMYNALAAADVGLGTCYIGAFKKYEAHKFLELDENEEVVLFTPLGYGNAEPRDTPRMELDEFVVYKD